MKEIIFLLLLAIGFYFGLNVRKDIRYAFICISALLSGAIFMHVFMTVDAICGKYVSSNIEINNNDTSYHVVVVRDDYSKLKLNITKERFHDGNLDNSFIHTCFKSEHVISFKKIK